MAQTNVPHCPDVPILVVVGRALDATSSCSPTYRETPCRPTFRSICCLAVAATKTRTQQQHVSRRDRQLTQPFQRKCIAIITGPSYKAAVIFFVVHLD